MSSPQRIKLQTAIAHRNAYIEALTKMGDHKLSRFIDLYREQMQMALKAGNTSAYELLCEYEAQAISARLRLCLS